MTYSISYPSGKSFTHFGTFKLLRNGDVLMPCIFPDYRAIVADEFGTCVFQGRPDANPTRVW